ncbi:class I poly(R)-hydroxyalkanoic acid synthase [Sphingomonas oleivorans]|uniref:Class I poly(R)-hydroxyalkanoic acid synthase n=1 Tax=Sphingomonas oleivorans TaxID=1735121 RepID=A0A2T5G0U7_9SPHN|nr:class I poly(R)-hydroxyalkanoic acid synthase [Sphingomonas oleivorans]PTQ12785.1 class I poly(R)-hydroxyalkanoic acid synthase [Sphingomonas oleivorans]
MADGQDGRESADMGSTLRDLQHWTGVIGRAQQMMLEHAAEAAAMTGGKTQEPIGALVSEMPGPALPGSATLPLPDPAAIARAQSEFWAESLNLWQGFLAKGQDAANSAFAIAADKDKRFSAPQWREHPLFDLIRQTYLMIADHLMKGVEELEDVDRRQKEQIRFATKTFVEAMSPANFAATNPLVLEKMFETRGENLLRGLEYMLADLRRGQLTQGDRTAFELGVNIATTPGKVIHETPLYQLIQYEPMTDKVLDVPLLIFPPWINRFYILDLKPENSFIRWAVEQGLTVFVLSWKSADETMAETTMEDYVLRGQAEAIDLVRDLLDVPAVHTIGYCVAGTTLAMTLAWLAATGQAAKVASATFFTAQVDFTEAGDLSLFVTDEQLKLIEKLSANTGYLDGRYMAATFNLLRGRDLIWNYVVNNYLLGQDYVPFDLLHWNSDVTNLPAKWHRAYLEDFYRGNRLVEAGALNIAGTPIDLGRVETPAYVEAGREDHIAPPESVWKLTQHLKGPIRFVLAGSGHIAGVINPPAKNRYQYWTNPGTFSSLEDFIAGAVETKGSWWPDWRNWIGERSGGTVEATGARIPGGGKLPPLEEAPGSYVRSR